MRVPLTPDHAYDVPFPDTDTENWQAPAVVWTPTLRRMFALSQAAVHHCEPLLLVGETGTGKTTACQLLAARRGQRLRIVNCSRHTEASDFLGGYRPVRDRERYAKALASACEELAVLVNDAGVTELLQRVVNAEGGELGRAVEAASGAVRARVAGVGGDVVAKAESLLAAVGDAAGRARAPFEWVDGPLVTAMREGDMFLIDELNLVRERGEGLGVGWEFDMGMGIWVMQSSYC